MNSSESTGGLQSACSPFRALERARRERSPYCSGRRVLLQLYAVFQAKDGLSMKNFLRALRYIIPYRRRLILSIICALLAAVLWGLNFTAVYPFLKVLTTGQNLQTWIDDTITKQE